jgi:hypothetical protein
MDPRYPVGKFVPEPDVNDEKRRAAIDQLARLPQELIAAVEQLPPGGLDTPYRPGGWTARQVVHHLADSHLNAYTRMKLALTEEAPTIKTYQEQLWAELPDAKLADVAPSLAMLHGLHARLVTMLGSLEPAQFRRTIAHPERGPMTLDALVQMYAWHCRHHLAHIRLSGQAVA